jgi:hypothetical protein
MTRTALKQALEGANQVVRLSMASDTVAYDRNELIALHPLNRKASGNWPAAEIGTIRSLLDKPQGRTELADFHSFVAADTFRFAVDFEASRLPQHGRSYPIEVGIADAKGWSRSWLIKPLAEWTNWTWTAEAEGLHGISREELFEAGVSPERVMHELNEAAGLRTVHADHDLDRRWLATLETAAGMSATFRIAHVADLLDRLRPNASAIGRSVGWPIVLCQRVIARHSTRAGSRR